MKKCLYILLFLSCLVWGQNKQYSKIFWNENRALAWKDFKGKADTNRKNAAALSFCGIQYTSCVYEGGKYTYQVSSFFVPVLSWGKVKTEIILKHEQLHFNIAELYARKLRKAFVETEVLPENSQKQVYDPLFKEYTQTQELYDRETQHGILQEENKIWEEKIARELKELEAYKNEETCY